MIRLALGSLEIGAATVSLAAVSTESLLRAASLPVASQARARHVSRRPLQKAGNDLACGDILATRQVAFWGPKQAVQAFN